MVQVQYKAGGASYLQVLTAEQAYQNATLALVKARAQRFLDTAALFQALGGGWWNRSDTNAPVPAAQGISVMMNSPVLDGGRSPGPRRMVVALMVVVLFVALIVGGVFGWQAIAGSFFKKFMEQAAAAPQTVSTVTAAKTAWQAQVRAIGSLRAVRGADLSAQASGVVDSIEFDSGNDVPAGKVLLKLRPNDDFAKLDQLRPPPSSRRRP